MNNDRNNGMNHNKHFNTQIVNICRVLNDVASSSIGPLGKVHVMKRGIGANANFDMLSSSELLLDQLSFDHPIAKILSQALRAHNRSYHDHGYSFLFYCTGFVLRLLDQDDQVADNSMSRSGTFESLVTTMMNLPKFSHVEAEWCHRLLSNWIDQFFDVFPSKRTATVDNIPLITQFLCSILSSNHLVNMRDDEVQMLAIQLIKTFYRSVLPTSTTTPNAHRQFQTGPSISHVHIRTVVHPDTDLTQSKLVDGVLLDMTMPIEARYLIHKHGNIQNLKVILYDVILDDNATIPSSKFNVSPPENGPNADSKTIVIGGDSSNTTPKSNIESLESRSIVFYEGWISKLMEMKIGIVACQKTIQPYVKSKLINRGILPLERLSLRHIEQFKQVSQAHVLSELSLHNLDDHTVIGSLKLMNEVLINGRSYIHIEGHEQNNPRTTLILHTAFQHQVSDLEYMCQKALKLLCRIASSGTTEMVPAGGISELALAQFLNQKVATYCDANKKLSVRMKHVLTSFSGMIETTLHDYIYNLRYKERTREQEMSRDELIQQLTRLNMSLISSLTEQQHGSQSAARERSSAPRGLVFNRTNVATMVRVAEVDSAWDMLPAKKEAIQSALEYAITITNIDGHYTE